MRLIRRLIPGLVLLALTPRAGAAQEGRLFKDSWFFGAKAGNMTYWTTTTSHAQAPLFGGETLITRSQGGLYLSLDQAFFTGTTTVSDAEGDHLVDIRDNKRVTAAAMIFPKEYGWVRPYAGLGFAFNFIQSAGSRTAVSAATASLINEQKTRAAPILMLGAQLQLARFSVFGQGSYMPAKADFVLNNNSTYFLETGIRYNIGSSIEKLGR